MHRIYLELFGSIPAPPGTLLVSGDEAEHALRVKRLVPGDPVELLDGAGTVVSGRVCPAEPGKPAGSRKGRERTLAIEVVHVRREPVVRPRVEVLCATPKGGRVDDMIDALCQLGVAAWRPLRCERSVVDPRPAKLDRLTRIAREACKQARRAWMLEIGDPADFVRSLGPEPDVVTIIADASGGSASGVPRAERIRLLVGPEGGFTPEELARARSAGAHVVRFGPHTMRIETAAPAAAAVLLSEATGSGLSV